MRNYFYYLKRPLSFLCLLAFIANVLIPSTSLIGETIQTVKLNQTTEQKNEELSDKWDGFFDWFKTPKAYAEGEVVTTFSGTIQTGINNVWGKPASSTANLKGDVIVLTNQVVVPSGVTLTIEPGTVVKMYTTQETSSTSVYKQIQVAAGGKLIADGTTTEPIIITAFRDDTYGGDTNGDGVSSPAANWSGKWGRIYFSGNNQGSVLKNMKLINGGSIYRCSSGNCPYGMQYGYASNGAIEVYGATNEITIEDTEVLKAYKGMYVQNGVLNGNNVTIKQAEDRALRADLNSTLNINDSTLESNNYGIDVLSDTASVNINRTMFAGNSYGIYGQMNGIDTFADNDFTGNTTYAVFKTGGEAVMENTFWGDASGPLDNSDDTSTGGLYNPAGLGDRVSDHVDYQPFKTSSSLSDNVWPNPITNLGSVTQTETSITLQFTASGDDLNIGMAKEYDVRYSATPITNISDYSLLPSHIYPVNVGAGGQEQIQILNLQPVTKYYFAIIIRDDNQNVSALSNIYSVETKGLPEQVTSLILPKGADNPANFVNSKNETDVEFQVTLPESADETQLLEINFFDGVNSSLQRIVPVSSTNMTVTGIDLSSLDDGVIQVEAYLRNVYGIGPKLNYQVTKDTVTAVPVVTFPNVVNGTTDNRVEDMEVTAEEGSKIYITGGALSEDAVISNLQAYFKQFNKNEDKSLLAKLIAKVYADSTNSVSVGITLLPDQDQNIQVTAIDPAGNSADASVLISQILTDDLLVASVSSQPVSDIRVAELISEGLIQPFDPSEYFVSEFRVGMNINGWPKEIKIPVTQSYESKPAGTVTSFGTTNIGSNGDVSSNGGTGYGANTWGNTSSVSLFTVQPPGENQEPIPGALILDGNVKQLKSYFDVHLILQNTSTVLDLDNIYATILDLSGLTRISPDAATISNSKLLASDKFSADFVVRGDVIGNHDVKINFGAEITVSGITYPLIGQITETIEVLSPADLSLEVGYPSTISQGDNASIFVKVKNLSSNIAARFVTMDLNTNSNLEFVDSGSDHLNLSFGTILAGEDKLAAVLVKAKSDIDLKICGDLDNPLFIKIQEGNCEELTLQSLINISTPPFNVRDSVPKNGQTGIDPSSGIYVAFTDPINSTSVNSTNIDLKNGDLEIPVTFNTSGDAIQIIPSEVLVENTTYVLSLKNLKNTSNNDLQNEYQVVFTTGIRSIQNQIKPRIIFTNPLNGSEDIAITNKKIYVGFDTEIDSSTLSSISLKKGEQSVPVALSLENEKTVRVETQDALGYLSQYSIFVDGVKDVRGIQMDGTRIFTFITQGRLSNPPVRNIIPAVDQSPVTGTQTVTSDSTDLGDPVMIHSGEFTYNETLLTLPGIGGVDYQFALNYGSRIEFDGVVGHNFDHNYNERIFLNDDESINYYRGDSRKDVYIKNDLEDSLEDATFTSPLGFYNQMDVVGAHVKLRERNGILKTFDLDKGYLIKIEDQYGNALTFTYNSFNQIDTVTDPRGRIITYSYDTTKRLIKVSDDTGRSVSLDYYTGTEEGGSENDLKSITTPKTTEYPDGKTQTFTYTKGFFEAKDNHNMLTLTDAKGITYVSNEYSGDDRILTQDFGNGNVSYAYSLSGERVNENHVTDRNGNETLYKFDDSGHIVEKIEFSGENNETEHITKYTYDENGNVQTKVNPKGDGEKYIYDISNPISTMRGNLLELRKKSDMSQPDNDAYDIVSKFKYDSVFNRVVEVTDPMGNSIKTYLDYQEGVSLQSLSEISGIEETLLSNALDGADIHLNLGDLNGDGISQTVFSGKSLKETLPVITTYDNSTITPEKIYRYNDKGQLTYTKDISGVEKTYSYYSAGSSIGYLESVTVDPTGKNISTRYEYDDRGNTKKVIDPNGKETVFTVNEQNQVTKKTLTSPFNYETKYEYDENNNITKVAVSNIDSLGQLNSTLPWIETEFGYDLLDRKISESKTISNTTKAITRFGYDANENLISSKSSLGIETKYNYDERDRISSITEGAGSNTLSATTRTEYDENGNLIAVIDALGNRSTILYDGFNRRIGTIDALGNETKTYYDKNGNIIKTEKYDDEENLLEEKIYEYNSLSLPKIEKVKLSDVEYSEKQTFYDQGLRIKKTVDAAGLTTLIDYDSAGRVDFVTVLGGHKLGYEYDLNSNVLVEKETAKISETENETFLNTKVYDELNRVVKVIDNSGNETEIKYDSRGQVEKIIDAKGNEVRVSYDGLGRKIKTSKDLKDQVTGLVSDTVNESYEYDLDSKLTSQTDANSNKTQYQYDDKGRLIEVTYPEDNAYEQYNYDANDNISRKIDRNGNEFLYDYDDLNRKIAVDVNYSGEVTGATRQTFAYDAIGRLTKATDDGSDVTNEFGYDLGGRLVNEKSEIGSSNDKLISYNYDVAGRKTGMTYPNSGEVSYTYDDQGRVEKILENTSEVIDYAYKGMDRLETATLGNGIVETKSYDNLKRISEIVQNGVSHNKYTYDQISNRTSTENLLEQEKSETYNYDSLSRLIEYKKGLLQNGQIADPTTSTKWTLDKLGNFDQILKDGITETRTHNGLNQILTSDSQGEEEEEPVEIVNLSLNRKVLTSGDYSATYAGKNAVDGEKNGINFDWFSFNDVPTVTNPNWLILDLAKKQDGSSAGSSDYYDVYKVTIKNPLKHPDRQTKEYKIYGTTDLIHYELITSGNASGNKNEIVYDPSTSSGQSQVIGTYRYIKFVIESALKAGGLSEIEVYGVENDKFQMPNINNLALNKTVLTSADYSTTYKGANAVDGSLTNYDWFSNFDTPSTTNYNWLQIDLGSYNDISMIRFMNPRVHRDRMTRNYKILGTNDRINYTELSSGDATGSTDWIALRPAQGSENLGTYRYIKFVIESASKAGGLSEIEIYGEENSNYQIQNPINLALNSTVLTSANYSTTYKGENAKDGSLTNYDWFSNNDVPSVANPNWIEFNLTSGSEAVSISMIRFMNPRVHRDRMTKSYKIQGSNDKITYTDITSGDATNTTDWVTLRSAQGSEDLGSYKYIKFLIESASKAGGLSEFEVYGSSVASSEPVGPPNLALNKSVLTSGDYSTTYKGSNAVDGSLTNYDWFSFNDNPTVDNPNWLQIDLADYYDINMIRFMNPRIHRDRETHNWKILGTNDLINYTEIRNGNADGTTDWVIVGEFGTYKYLKFMIESASKAGGLSEMEVYGERNPNYEAQIPNNLALNKTVLTSGDYSTTYKGSNALDGSLTNYDWFSFNDSPTSINPNWMQIDLGSTNDLNMIRFMNPRVHRDRMTKSYKIQGSNDKIHYTDLNSGDATGSTDWTTLGNIDNGNIGTFRYIKFVIESASKAGGLSEIEIYGVENPNYEIQIPNNIALTASVTISANYSTTYKGENAKDGSLTNYDWFSNNDAPSVENPNWLELDLGGAKDVAMVRLMNPRVHRDRETHNYKLLGSVDQVTYDELSIGDMDNTTDWVSIGNPEPASGTGQGLGTYRYIKFVIESANKAGGLSEIEIYESSDSLSFINTVANYFVNIFDKNIDTAIAEEPAVINPIDPTKVYNYDKNGNLLTDGTRVFVYDAFNRMVKVLNRADNAEIAKYGYDAFGDRVLKTVNNITTRYVYSGKQVIEEYEGDILMKSYIYGTMGLDDVVKMKTNSNDYYYHKDILGSVIALSDETGSVVEKYEYDAYGKTTVLNSNGVVISASTVGNDFGYTGQRNDNETGLYYYKARYYSTEMGRFMNMDPEGYSEGMNLYAYVNDNPVNFNDPLGLYKEGSSSNVGSGVLNYLGQSFEQLVLGNYSDSFTALGTVMQILGGLTGADLAGDVRDLSYDMAHWNDTSRMQIALDLVAFAPIFGGLKYSDEAMALLKKATAMKAVSNISDVIGRAVKPMENLRPDIIQDISSGARLQPYKIIDGKIKNAMFGNRTLSGDFDYIVNSEGKMIIGKQHSFLAQGEDVYFGGQMHISNKGTLTKVNDMTGHYYDPNRLSNDSNYIMLNDMTNILEHNGFDTANVDIKPFFSN